MDIFPRIILILILIFVNGFFVASEIVLISIRKSRVDQLVKEDNPAAKLLSRALENLDSYISATQLGVTIVSLILGFVGEPTIAQVILTLVMFLPTGIATIAAHTLAIIISFLLITYLQIVIGELVPKAIALERTELVAMIVIAPLSVFAELFRHFIKIINKSANLVLRLIKIPPPSDRREEYTEEELKIILETIGKNRLLPKDEIEMAQNVFKLKNIPIRQIMMPRMDVIAFELSTSLKKLVSKIEKKEFSRYPVYDRTIDNIVGFIHVKDVYREILKTENHKKLSQTNLMRKIMIVPEGRSALDILHDMRKKHIHVASVDDEFGMTVGMVTLEDIIECLVGEIQDEFDKPIHSIKRQVDGSYLIEGRAEIDLVKKRFNLNIIGQSYTTLGGLIFGLLGREPRISDRVQLGNIIFEVIKVDGKRIDSIRLTKDTKKDKN